MPCQAASVSAAGRALCKLASLCIPEFIKEHTAASSLSQLKDQINLCLVSQGPSWRAVICAGRSRAVGGLWFTHTLSVPPGRLPRGCGGGGDTWPGLGRDHKTLLLHNSHGSLWEGVFHGKMGWSIVGVGSPWASITLQPLLPQGAAKCRLIPLGVQGVTTLFTELAGGFSAFSLNI